MSKYALKILITGAAGQIAYSLLPMIANGDVFGKNQKIIFHLLDLPQSMEILKGVNHELEDGCFPLLENILITDQAAIAFIDIDVAILLAGFPRLKGMNRNDLISKNVPIFKSSGEYLNKYAKKTCKVLVVANPANTNCLVTLKNCNKLNKKNFTCLSMLDHNRAKSYLSNKLNKSLEEINNIIIWGNHSKTQYPDISQISNINFNNIDKNNFIETIQNRGDVIINLRKLSSAMSAARAISDHLRIWLVDGTKEGEIISLGVYSNGEYGVSSDLVFSFPCKCVDGEYYIVNNLKLNQDTIDGIKKSEKELLEEKEESVSV
jgi:malate dehydrogenase